MSFHSPEAALRNRLFTADRPDCKRRTAYNRPVVSPRQNIQSSFDSGALPSSYPCYCQCTHNVWKEIQFLWCLGLQLEFQDKKEVIQTGNPCTHMPYANRIQGNSLLRKKLVFPKHFRLQTVMKTYNPTHFCDILVVLVPQYYSTNVS